MNRNSAIAAILICAVLIACFAIQKSGLRDSTGQARSWAKALGFATGEAPAAPAGFKTKLADRIETEKHRTHQPERLKDFMLPAIPINRLTLREALGILTTAYGEACQKSGESTLNLKFDIPPGTRRKLTVQLPGGNFNASVRILGALSGMNVTRDELIYRFESIKETGTPVESEIELTSSGLHDTLKEFANLPEGNDVSLNDCLIAMGFDLDPSTRLSFGENGCFLRVKTSSAVDHAAIEELARQITSHPAPGILTTTKTLELSAGSSFEIPETGDLDSEQLQMLMRRLAQIQGTEIRSHPSIISNNGQTSTVGLSRELVVPVNGSSTEFEKHRIGTVFDIQTDALGFGCDVNVDYTHKTADLNPDSGNPTINEPTHITDAGFSKDGRARLKVLTREDGTKTILVVTSQLIDQAGQTLRSYE